MVDSLLIVTPIVGFCFFMFCCTLLWGHSSFAIISMVMRELVDMLCLSFWCLVSVVWLFLMMPRVCLQFVIMVFPDHTHLLFLWSPAGRELTSWLSLVVFNCVLVTFPM